MTTGEQETERPEWENLVYTSVDDLKSSLAFVTSAEVLNQARKHCFESGERSKLLLIERRIRALKRGAR